MNRNKWIAVVVGIFIVVFFLFGRDLVDFFQGTSASLPVNQAQNQVDFNFKVEDLVVGTGDTVALGDLVTVHYVGTFMDGKVFDSSLARKQPFQFTLGAGQVIQGWDRGIEGMKVGGKRKLTIPPSMGYGSNAVGPIPPNSTLIFEVELLKTEHNSTQGIEAN